MKKIISILFFVFMTFICQSVYSQPENVHISADSRIQHLLERHIQLNEIQASIPGFRLQLFIGSGNFSRNNAIAEKQRFDSRFSQDKSYLIFNTPNYIVRVGDFRTRIEAEAYRQKILGVYPEAYIVRDDIALPK